MSGRLNELQKINSYNIATNIVYSNLFSEIDISFISVCHILKITSKRSESVGAINNQLMCYNVCLLWTNYLEFSGIILLANGGSFSISLGCMYERGRVKI